MSISYFGHCALGAEEAQRRIASLRALRPDWFGGVVHLGDASPLTTAEDRTLSARFGIAAQCRFAMHVRNKDRLAAMPDAIDLVYRTFGTDNLVISFELELIHPPRRHYRAQCQ